MWNLNQGSFIEEIPFENKSQQILLSIEAAREGV